MISGRFKFRTIMIAILMLFMIGLSVKDAKSQVICPGPGNAFQVGWLDITSSPVFPPAGPGANFIAADLFLAQLFPPIPGGGGFITGGLDWFYASIFSFTGSGIIPEIDISGNDLVVRGSLLNTTITGSQLVSKYNQKAGRNTFVEVGNSARGVCDFGFFEFLRGRQFDPIVRECGDNIDCLPSANQCIDEGPFFGTCTITGAPCDPVTGDFDCATCNKSNVEVHVEVQDENCEEVCDFCDVYTPVDKHVYDLGNLVRNFDGLPVGCRDNIQNNEGFLLITATKNCTTSTHQARDFNFLFGDMELNDPRIDVNYGENLQARLALSLRGSCRINGEECFFDETLNFPDFTCEGDNCDGAIIGFCNTDGGDQCFNQEDCRDQGLGDTPCVSTGGEGPAAYGTCSETGRDCQNFINPCDFNCCDEPINGDGLVVNCNREGCDLTSETCENWENCDENNECILDGSGCPDHCLDGDLGCELVSYIPRFLRKDFHVDPGSVAGADLVKFSFVDVYDDASNSFSYSKLPGLVTYRESICDDKENCVSCGSQTDCYARVGVNDDLPLIDPPNPIIATPTPVVTPTPIPTPTPVATPSPTPQPCEEDDDCTPPEVCIDDICQLPTPTPTKTGNGDAGGGCSISAPVQLGTAMANILIPLVPAIAIGFRFLRKRNKRNSR